MNRKRFSFSLSDLLERFYYIKRFKLVYFSRYVFNYSSHKGLVFLCVTSTTFQTRVAFAYLQHIQSQYRPGVLGFDHVLRRESVITNFNWFKCPRFYSLSCLSLASNYFFLVNEMPIYFSSTMEGATK